MADIYPLQPAYGLTKKVAIAATATNVDLSDWNQTAQGFTQVLITNTASDMIFVRFGNDTKVAEKDKDLPIIATAPMTVTRNQTDNNFSIIGSVAGGFVWITPIIGD